MITVLSIFGMYTLSAFANVIYFNPQVESFSNILHIKEANLISSELKIVEVKLPEIKTHIKFLDDIGFRESSNNYKAVNQFGYLGKYQFGRI